MSDLCPACDSPSPDVRLLIQRPCTDAWHNVPPGDAEAVPVPNVAGAALCPRHARQAQESGDLRGECDKPKWWGGDGSVYGCDVLVLPERADLYASFSQGEISRDVFKARLAELARTASRDDDDAS